MEKLQEKLETTKTVLTENILESVTEFQTETNSDITLEQLYSLCEEATALLLEMDIKDQKRQPKKKKPKPAGKTPGVLKSGPSDRPWRSGKLVRFRKLRSLNKNKLEESATDTDVNECADQMVEIFVAEGVLDTIQSVGDVASAIPKIGGLISAGNAVISGARSLLSKDQTQRQEQAKLAALRTAGAFLPGGALAARFGGSAMRNILTTSNIGKNGLGGIGRLAANPAAAARLAGRTIRNLNLSPAIQKIGQQFQAGMRTGPVMSTVPVTKPAVPPTAIMPMKESVVPDYIKVGIGQSFGKNTTNPEEINTIMNIVNEGKVKIKKKIKKPVVGEDGTGIVASRPLLVGSQGLGPVQSGEGSVIDPLAMRGIYGTSLGPIREDYLLKEYVKNPIANKEKKQKFKIVFTEGGKKLEAFAGSERGVKRAVYGKKNYRVYSATGSDVTKIFKK